MQKPVELTTQTKPEAAIHWSTRKMAAQLGVAPSTVMRHWQVATWFALEEGTRTGDDARLQTL